MPTLADVPRRQRAFDDGARRSAPPRESASDRRLAGRSPYCSFGTAGRGSCRLHDRGQRTMSSSDVHCAQAYRSCRSHIARAASRSVRHSPRSSDHIASGCASWCGACLIPVVPGWPFGTGADSGHCTNPVPRVVRHILLLSTAFLLWPGELAVPDRPIASIGGSGSGKSHVPNDDVRSHLHDTEAQAPIRHRRSAAEAETWPGLVHRYAGASANATCSTPCRNAFGRSRRQHKAARVSIRRSPSEPSGGVQ